jgi:hypothetical protein
MFRAPQLEFRNVHGQEQSWTKVRNNLSRTDYMFWNMRKLTLETCLVEYVEADCAEQTKYNRTCFISETPVNIVLSIKMLPNPISHVQRSIQNYSTNIVACLVPEQELTQSKVHLFWKIKKQAYLDIKTKWIPSISCCKSDRNIKLLSHSTRPTRALFPIVVTRDDQKRNIISSVTCHLPPAHTNIHQTVISRYF